MTIQTASLDVVEAARQGDKVAFELLLDPLLDQAYRLAGGLLHDHFAAEDAVQEACWKAWRKIHQLRPGSSMGPWFFAIVANECRSARRSRWSGVIRTDAVEAVQRSSEDALLTGFEVRQALRSMDEDKRLVLVLHWYLDLPVDQVAATIGTSVRGAETRLLRAKNELRKRMEAHRGRH